MSTPFSRSMHSLAADRFHGSLFGVLLVAALLRAWATWFFFARLTLYEVSATARLEVSEAAHSVEAQVTGRIRATYLILGQEVQGGEVLVELDADAHRLRLEEERARLTALVSAPAMLRNEISAAEAAQREDQQAGRIAQDQARARYREAEAAAQLSRQEAARMERLLARAYVAELDALRAKAEARKQREAADALRLEISRLEWDLQLRLSGRQAHMQWLMREVTQLEGQIATTRAVIEQLEHEIEQRYIRAPVTGCLGEVAGLQVGAVVRPDAAPPIPLQHGMPGTVEVEVDRVSPAMLVLRTAGLLLTVPGTSRTLQGGRGAGR